MPPLAAHRPDRAGRVRIRLHRPRRRRALPRRAEANSRSSMSAIKIAKDLRSMFGPVRDQGQRPTCLAFAASDLHAAVRGAWAPLSCEYIFYHAQKARTAEADGRCNADVHSRSFER